MIWLVIGIAFCYLFGTWVANLPLEMENQDEVM